jgi:antitoxin (DNA-binding transcriptional repressor) of toxin-antitoxin stability system
MKFMSVRDFRVNTGQMRRGLDKAEEVILTANGKPFAIVSAIRPEEFDKELRAIRCARAKVALDRARESALQAGTAEMPLPEINKIIADVRRRKVRT